MIKEVAPAIFSANNLGALESRHLWKGMTNAQYANWNGSAFVRAMIDFSAFKSGGKNLMGNSPDLYLDYEFWTRTGVRWLFHKYIEVGQKSWRDAVRAFNGAGPEAERYAIEVMSRVTGAQSIEVGIE